MPGKPRPLVCGRRDPGGGGKREKEGGGIPPPGPNHDRIKNAVFGF
jgi:hypothetical protein